MAITLESAAFLFALRCNSAFARPVAPGIIDAGIPDCTRVCLSLCDACVVFVSGTEDSDCTSEGTVEVFFLQRFLYFLFDRAG